MLDRGQNALSGRKYSKLSASLAVALSALIALIMKSASAADLIIIPTCMLASEQLQMLVPGRKLQLMQFFDLGFMILDPESPFKSQDGYNMLGHGGIRRISQETSCRPVVVLEISQLPGWRIDKCWLSTPKGVRVVEVLEQRVWIHDPVLFWGVGDLHPAVQRGVGSR